MQKKLMSGALISSKRGITLVELLIVVAIVAILAAFAYPNYARHMQEGRRTEAMTELMHLANLQEQYYLDYQSYAKTLSALGKTATPHTSENGFYEISLAVTDAVIDFQFTATAKGVQANDTDCATMSLNQDGLKTATTANCWR